MAAHSKAWQDFNREIIYFLRLKNRPGFIWHYAPKLSVKKNDALANRQLPDVYRFTDCMKTCENAGIWNKEGGIIHAGPVSFQVKQV